MVTKIIRFDENGFKVNLMVLLKMSMEIMLIIIRGHLLIMKLMNLGWKREM